MSTTRFPFDPYDKSDKEKAQAIHDGLKWMDKLERTADVVLAYRPKSRQPKPRKRKKAKRRGK